MNTQIEKLYRIAGQEERRIIGLMSGTSLDGLDIACCKLRHSGTKTKLVLEHFCSIPYSEAFRIDIRRVFAKHNIDQSVLSGLHAAVGRLHASFILDAIQNWDIPVSSVDAIASHGQTVYHAPQRLSCEQHFPNSTLQIGDADHIAYNTGIITLSDFRQKHLAAGGEGAPLAVYGDYLLFRSPTENRILLNIGGIANFTFLPSAGSNDEAFATDLGPGNTLMNQFMQKTFGKEMDRDAQLAKKGLVNDALLSTLLSAPFFNEAFPKTTGPELFNLKYLEKAQTLSANKSLTPEDILATLNRFTSESIARGIRQATKKYNNVQVYISGGGAHNPLLLENIRQALPNLRIASSEKLGLNPDAKEACLFAVLANETLVGTPEHVQGIRDAPSICMGKISLPY